LPDFEGADYAVLDDPTQVGDIAAAVTTPPISLSQDHVSNLVAFLQTLTDPISIKGRLGVPTSVPSGLPVPTID
jgi:cytochrome c peroxidase